MNVYATNVSDDGTRAPRARLSNSAKHCIFFGSIVGGLLALCVMSSMQQRPYRVFRGSKTDIAKATVRKYAYEAFLQWKGDHPSQVRPLFVGELNEYMNDNKIEDPWGMPYVLWPPRSDQKSDSVLVMSAGPDCSYFTGDDVRSDL